MRNGLKMSVYVMTVFWILSSLTLNSCATASSVPSDANRTLRISADRPALEYRYLVCTKRVFICVKQRWQVDYYDLTDPEVRKTLIHMGFVVKVREKP
jgi:hypothetical protein